MVLIRPDKRLLHFSFLCHWLNSPIMAAHIHGYRDGTVAERLNLPTIRVVPILIPPLADQKAIAAVLGALDDKIELNRRMNAMLNTSLWVKEFKRVSPPYAFHLLRSLDFEMFNAGSAVPTLNRNHVHNLRVVIPPKPIIEAFDAQVMPLMKQQKANEDQSRTLATLRDTLLPKLLSGELRLKELPYCDQAS